MSYLIDLDHSMLHSPLTLHLFPLLKLREGSQFILKSNFIIKSLDNHVYQIFQRVQVQCMAVPSRET